ncbi:hypothetical protein [Microcoleus sp. Pol12A5]|uniref:hypothetical protein n=1 Tax=Microcoleus sp. Pol12A5 TaxID=3055392 RepID=UPI002FD1B4E6
MRANKVRSSRNSLGDRTQLRRLLGFLTCYPQVVLLVELGSFRFIRNHSRATATNVYLMLYPKPALAKAFLEKPELLKEVWQALDRLMRR